MIETAETVVGKLTTLSIGAAVLIVEQHIQMAQSVADRAYVMSHGEVSMSGTAAEMLARRDLLEASYMGEKA